MSDTGAPVQGYRQRLGCALALLAVVCALSGLTLVVNRVRQRHAAARAAQAVLLPPGSGAPGGEVTQAAPQPERDPFSRTGRAEAPPVPATPWSDPLTKPSPPSPGGTLPPASVQPKPDGFPPPAIGGDPGEPGPPHISRDPGEPGPPARKIGPPPARKGGPRPAKAAPPAKPPAPTPGELARLDQRPGAWQTPPGPGQNGLNLVAVVQGKRPQAVFKLRGAYVRAREGDKVGDYTVERIAEREVYLLQGGHRDRLPLAKRGAPPAGETKEPAKSEQPEEPAADEPAAAPVKKARPRLGPPLPLSPGGPGKQS